GELRLRARRLRVTRATLSSLGLTRETVVTLLFALADHLRWRNTVRRRLRGGCVRDRRQPACCSRTTAPRAARGLERYADSRKVSGGTRGGTLRPAARHRVREGLLAHVCRLPRARRTALR